MFLTDESYGKLRIRDFALIKIAAFLFFLGLALILGIPMVLTLPFPPPTRSYMLIFAVFLFLAFALWMLVTIKLRTTTIDRTLHVVSVTITRIWGSKYTQYRFSELSASHGGIRVNTDYRKSRSGSSEYKVYGLQLQLASGESIDLTEYSAIQLSGCEAAAGKASKLIAG